MSVEGTRQRYLDLELPEHFALEIRSTTGIWSEWGVYWARNFTRLEDGAYVCGGYPYGSPTWLRCIMHHDGYFEHVDGDGHGDVHAYRLIALSPAPGQRR